MLSIANSSLEHSQSFVHTGEKKSGQTSHDVFSGGDSASVTDGGQKAARRSFAPAHKRDLQPAVTGSRLGHGGRGLRGEERKCGRAGGGGLEGGMAADPSALRPAVTRHFRNVSDDVINGVRALC